MRITKSELEAKESRLMSTLTTKTRPFKSHALSTDLANDMLAMFKAKSEDTQEEKKSSGEIIDESYENYVQGKTRSGIDHANFYGSVKKTLANLRASKLFQKVSEALEPVDAVAFMFDLISIKKNEGGESGSGSGGGGQSGGDAEEDNQKGEGLQNMLAALNEAEQALGSGAFEEDEEGDAIRNALGVGTEHNEIILHEHLRKIVAKLATKSGQRLRSIFELSRHMGKISKYTVGSELQESSSLEDDFDYRSIKNLSRDLQNIVPTELAMDDDLFYQRLLTKQTLVRVPQQSMKKQQALYILVDGSCSMSGYSSVYASAVAASLVKQSITEGAKFFLRVFDYDVHEIKRATNKEEGRALLEYLLADPFSGGGTDIERALMVAIKDIKGEPEKFHKAEIMVITDGCDDVSPANVKKENIKIHTVLIGANNPSLLSVCDTSEEVSRADIQDLLREANQNVFQSN